MNEVRDTIAAISSAVGQAARMVIRLCGAGSFEIASRIIDGGIGRLPGASSKSLRLGELKFTAWVYCFASPHSYNGEDLIEFHIPGNPLLAKMLLEQLLRSGARLAEPGEFTARAYFNGRLDLTEAEGVAAVISAANEQELAAARRLLSGELARRLEPAIDALADTLALLEVSIDFTDEDVTFLSPSDLAGRIDRLADSLKRLLAESARFERLSHEPTVVLIGRPNAGKSTLLNALAGEQRAVVSDVAGTTRDVLSAEVFLRRGAVRLMDVAGLETQSPADEISRKMQQRARAALEQADHVALVIEAGDTRPRVETNRPPELAIMTKADIHSVDSHATSSAIIVSAKTGAGLPALREAIDQLCFGGATASATLALNARHVNAIGQALEALSRASKTIDAGPELLAIELREALDALGQVTGRISPDDLLGRIFAAFCIGK